MYPKIENSKRIVNIVEIVDPTSQVPGGIDTAIFDIIKYGEDFEFNVIGITSKKELLGKWQKVKIADSNLNYFPISLIDKSRTRCIPHSIKFCIAMLKYRRSLSKLETMHFHRMELGLIASLLFPRTKISQFLHNDGANFQIGKSESVWRFFRSIYLLLEFCNAKLSRSLVVFSKPTAKRLSRHNPKVHHFTTWFDPEVFKRQKTSQLNDEKISVLFVGRLEQQKDPMLFLRVACEIIDMKKRDVHFHIVGSGNLLANILNCVRANDISEYVSVYGALPRTKVSQLMNSSSLLLMTSHYEGSPRVLYEAGACGLPIVATQESDPDEWIDGKNGFRVRSRSASVIADRVLRALELDREYCSLKVVDKSAVIMVNEILKFTENG